MKVTAALQQGGARPPWPTPRGSWGRETPEMASPVSPGALSTSHPLALHIPEHLFASNPASWGLVCMAQN